MGENFKANPGRPPYREKKRKGENPKANLRRQPYTKKQ
jgi:hypothetical protein